MRNRRIRRVRGSAASLVLVAVATAPADAQNVIERITTGWRGGEANAGSWSHGLQTISADGRFVVLTSLATNLVPGGDTNATEDVFVADRVTKAIVAISIAPSGKTGNGTSGDNCISADGRFVFFASDATNLVSNDTNKVTDVFVRDRDPDGNAIFDEGNATTERVSVSSGGAQADGASWGAACSPDGNLVVFASVAANLVSGDTNGFYDVFVRDRAQGTTVRVSVDSSGAQADGDCWNPAISADGRFVAFLSSASTLDARDHNGLFDAFLHDSSTGATTRVSGDASGGDGNGTCYYTAITEDGTLLAFDSFSSNLVANDTNGNEDVYLYDVATGITTLASVDSAGVQGNGQNGWPRFSGDGKHLGFGSASDNLVPGDTNGNYDAFVRDLSTGETACTSINAALQIGNWGSQMPSLSHDGTVVAYGSEADNLVSGDRNYHMDMFAVDRSILDPVASWTNYGSGFPGTNGIPDLVANSNPVVGTSFSIEVDNSAGPWAVGFLVSGLGQTSIPTRAGGTWLVDLPILILAFPIPPGGGPLGAYLPLDPGICGLELFNQVLELDPGAAHGLSFTPGLELTFGI